MQLLLWMTSFVLLLHPSRSFLKRTLSVSGGRRFTCSSFEMTKYKTTPASKQMKDTVRKSVTVTEKNRGFGFRTGPGSYSEHDRFLGVTNPNIRLIAKDNMKSSLDDLQVLLESEYNEERFLALVILTEQFKKADPIEAETMYQFYLSNLRHVNNWNLVDTSAHLVVGQHLLDKNRDHLITLAQSEVLWERRVAMVATWMFIRNKDLEWTFKLAEILLNDTHDLMHKAVGWMLREAGKKDVNKLLDFLDQYAAVMPRTMLRYSLEKLTDAQKKHYMSMKKSLK